MGKAARWLWGLFGGKSSIPNGGASVGARTSKEKRRWGFVASFREREIGKQQQRKEPPPNSPPPPPLAAAVAAVERLKSRRRNAEARREWAAMKIQAAFRGYLARRALRALKGLVKLQALVRGNIIRKQAAETLRCMQALVRVQARTRARRALGSERSRSNKSSRSCPGPPTPEKYEQPIRINAVKSEGSFNLKRNSSNPTSCDTIDQYNQNAQSSGWNWLDRWIEERYWDGREASTTNTAIDDEKNAKILEIDSGKPHFTHLKGRINNYIPQSVDADQSPVTPRFPLVEALEFMDSPLLYSASSSRPTVSSKRGPFTPVKSDCSVGSLFSGCSDYPNYMANTESSRAKVRSQSAPKQRPDFEPAGLAKRAPGGHGIGQRSASLHTKFANRAYPGSGRLDRLGMPLRI